MYSRFASSCTLALTFIVVALPAFATDALDFSSARDKSMGGRHVALADDSSALLSNPAALADLSPSYSFADVGLQAIGPVFDIANLIMKGDTSQSAIVGFLKDNDYKLNTGVALTGPLATGFTGNGLGFGLFNKTGLILNAASINSISVAASEDILLTGGYAVSFDLGGGHELAAGLGAKGYVLGSVAPNMGIVEATTVFSDLGSLLSGKAFDLTTGIGVDLGLRWAWKELAAGLVYRDAYSPAIVTEYSSLLDFISDSASSKVGDSTYKTLPSSLDVGFSWTPELGALSKVMDSLVLCLDYKDILDLFSVVPRNPILNVGFGLETKVLDIVRLRAGIADALLAAGMGVDLSVCTVNLAVFGTELGLDPGDRTCYNLLVDFSFKY